MRETLVRFLNLVTRSKEGDGLEWTNPRIVLVLVLWVWATIGIFVGAYGVYHYVFLNHEEYFNYLLIGFGIVFFGNLAALGAGKFLDRR